MSADSILTLGTHLDKPTGVLSMVPADQSDGSSPATLIAGGASAIIPAVVQAVRPSLLAPFNVEEVTRIARAHADGLRSLP